MFDQLRSEEDQKNVLEQGFTLVELLIVIIILGILAGIVVFAVGNLSQSSQKSACSTEAQTFYTAYQAYKAQNSGALPGAPTDNSWNSANTQVLPALTTAGNNQFLQKTPNLVSANGFLDDTVADYGAAINLATLKTNVNTRAAAVNHPVWAFLPQTGEVAQSSNGGNLNCS